MNTDFLIIGGGVIGLSIARALHKRGAKKITVVDQSILGQEASWAAAGMLAPNAETEEIDDFYRLCSESNDLYPRFAAELLEETRIDVELTRSGTLELVFDDIATENLNRKYVRQREADIEVGKLSPAEILTLEPNVSPDVLSGLHYPNDGQVENRKLVTALIEYARHSGIELIENTAIKDLLSKNGRVIEASTEGNAILAESVILATGAWSSHIKFGGLPTPFGVRPIRGQMLAYRGTPGLIGKVIYGAGAYLVPRNDGRILVGATAEDVGFDKSITKTATNQLREAAIRAFPKIAEMELMDSWSGLRPFAADGLPIIGGIEGFDNLMIATAHYRNGILLAPVTAEIVAEKMVAGVESNYLRLFNPGRFSCVANSAAR